MTIRRMFASEREVVVRLIATAMMGDPGWSAVEPMTSRRHELLCALVNTTVSQAMSGDGEVFVSDMRGVAAGALVWHAPGVSPLRKRDYVRTLAASAKYVAGRPRQAVDAVRFTAGIDAMKPQGDSAYVAFLGCAVRGQGVGSSLVRHILPLSGALPTTLETQNKANVALYKHLGFHVTNRREHVYPGGSYNIAMSTMAA